MSRWRRTRGWVVLALAVTLALAVAVWGGQDDPGREGRLDPRNPGPDGAQAVAKVLDHQGVDVTVVRSAADLADTRVDADTTVVATSTSDLSPDTLRGLRRHAAAGRLVLVEPPWPLLQEIDADQDSLPVTADRLAAACETVGGVRLDGLTISVDQATAYPGPGCFPSGPGRVLVEDRGLLVLGAGQALTNDQVLRADNAAVALRLLGADPRLVWYVPDPADASAGDGVTLGSLLPDWIGPGLWILALATLGLVLWRVRRLGPLATEPLPVVVRAVETARSRGRMYRRSGDRAHAARALRRAATTALAGRLRLERSADPRAVAAAVARHAHRDAAEVAALLTGPPPETDQELVGLAQALTRLREEVRRG
ncbi:MAG TPA: DUF4350 domain-containing protein [Nocardioides sp.]|nr:DUF4350 domain-containing protein [Nocardioides sp.]